MSVYERKTRMVRRSSETEQVEEESWRSTLRT